MKAIEFDFNKTRAFIDYLLNIRRRFSLIEKWLEQSEKEFSQIDCSNNINRALIILTQNYKKYAKLITSYLATELFNNFYPVKITSTIITTLIDTTNETPINKNEAVNHEFKYIRQYVRLAEKSKPIPIIDKYIDISISKILLDNRYKFDSMNTGIKYTVDGLMLWDSIIFYVSTFIEFYNLIYLLDKNVNKRITYNYVLDIMELKTESFKYYSNDIITNIISLISNKFTRGIYVDDYSLLKYKRFTDNKYIWIILGHISSSELSSIYNDLTSDLTSVNIKIINRASDNEIPKIYFHNDRYGYYKEYISKPRVTNQLIFTQSAYFSYSAKDLHNAYEEVILTNELRRIYKILVADKKDSLNKTNISLKLVNRYSRSSSFNNLIDEINYHLRAISTIENNNNTDNELSIVEYTLYTPASGKNNQCNSKAYLCINKIVFDYYREFDSSIFPDRTSINIKIRLTPISVII